MTRKSWTAKVAEKVAEKVAPQTHVNGHLSTPIALPSGIPEVWYEPAKKSYWALNVAGEWTEYSSTHIRDTLTIAGLSSMKAPSEPLAPVAQEMWNIRHSKTVAYAGPVAGFESGMHAFSGLRVLITRGPKRIKAARGEWPALRKFLGELLGEQVYYFYAWAKSSLRTLYAGPPFRPGQALCIAGPGGCGKSLLQNVITEIFGGRAAKPFRYMMGETGYNGEFLGAEHLMIEDEASSSDVRTRRYFGQQLKAMIANETGYCNPKFKEALNLTPFWRVTITLNDEPENLLVLPPVDDSIKDKFLLLKAYVASFPYGEDDLAGRKAYREQLTAELPAFLAFLHGWRIPDRMMSKRYGVKAWQNPDLLADLTNLQPEFRLLELIDSLGIWIADDREWKGSAQELRRALEDKDPRGEVARLLYYNTAAGVYLARLKSAFPHRIEQRRGPNNSTIWVIRR